MTDEDLVFHIMKRTRLCDEALLELQARTSRASEDWKQHVAALRLQYLSKETP
jgi:hypothetical protein